MAKRSKFSLALKAAQKLILAQGEVIYANNMLQDRFFRTFHIALSLERQNEFPWTAFYDHALALWHTVQSDHQQRKLTATAISTIPTQIKLGRAIRSVQWAKVRADDLAKYRNIIAHNTIMFSARFERNRLVRIPVFGSGSTRPTHREHFENTTLAFWSTLRTDLLNLSDYVEDVNRQIMRLATEVRGAELGGVPKTWPCRPRLRSIPTIRRLAKNHIPAEP